MADKLIYNGKDFSDFETFFDGSKSFDSPEKDVEFVEVPGRNGSLSFSNNSFKDIVIPFPCFIRRNFISNYRSLSEYLNSVNGFQRLECTKEPDHFRMASFVGPVEPQTTSFNHAGFFDINFRCHPQRWLKSGEEWYNVTFNMENPTLFNSYPIIRMYGNGSLMVNSVTITVTDSPFEFTDVDCETMNASYYTSNANAYVFIGTDNRISLNPGSNGFENTGFSKVEIMPRWYEI